MKKILLIIPFLFSLSVFGQTYNPVTQRQDFQNDVKFTKTSPVVPWADAVNKAVPLGQLNSLLGLYLFKTDTAAMLSHYPKRYNPLFYGIIKLNTDTAATKAYARSLIGGSSPDLTQYRKLNNHDSLSTLKEKSYNSLTDKPTIPDVTGFKQKNDSIIKSGYSTNWKIQHKIDSLSALKVDKVSGKALSSNDFTDADSLKLVAWQDSLLARYTKTQSDNKFALISHNQAQSTVTALSDSLLARYTKAQTNTLLLGKIDTIKRGQANGVASLDGNAKVPMSQINDALLGSVKFQTTWSPATNTPTLPTPSSANKGFYWIASDSAYYSGVLYKNLDMIVSDGVSWQKIDNNNRLNSVFGRVGNVIANSGDYNTDQVTEGSTNKYDKTVALSNGTGISVSGTYPNFTITNSSPSSGGTVTSVAGGTGLTGGIITTTGTLAIDTTVVAKKSTVASMYQPKGSYEVPLTFSSPLTRTVNTITHAVTGAGSSYQSDSNPGYFVSAFSYDIYGHASMSARRLASGDIPSLAQSKITGLSDSLLARYTKTQANAIFAPSSTVSMTYPGAGIPLSTGSAWGTSITNNSGNWNSAYGWGNHASAGYYKSGDSPTFGTISTASNGTSANWKSGYDAINGLTSGYIPYRNSTTLTNSPITTDGTNIGIGSTSLPSLFSISTNNSSSDWTADSNAAITLSNINTTANNMISLDFLGAIPGSAQAYSAGIGTTFIRNITNGGGDLWFMTRNATTGSLSKSMYILNNGNIGIGYTSGTEITGNKLAVNGNTYIGGILTATGAITAPTAKFTTLGAGTAVNQLGVTSDGTLTTNVPSVASGKYLPSFGSPTNLETVNLDSCTYSQTGKIVTVSLSGTVYATIAGYTTMLIYFPISGLHTTPCAGSVSFYDGTNFFPGIIAPNDGSSCILKFNAPILGTAIIIKGTYQYNL